MIKIRYVIVTHYFENKVMDVTTIDSITYMMSLKNCPVSAYHPPTNYKYQIMVKCITL